MHRMKQIGVFVQNIGETEKFVKVAKIFRISTYSWLLLHTLLILPYAGQILGPSAYVNFSAIDGPLGTRWLTVDTMSEHYLIFLVVYVAALIVGVLGYFPKFTSIAIWWLTLNINGKAYIVMDGGNNLFDIMCFYLIFINTSGRPLSSNSLPDWLRCFLRSTSNIAIFLCRLQVVAIYFCASIFKLNGELWQSGMALYYILQSDYSLEIWQKAVKNMAWFAALGTYFAVFFQMSFPFFVWIKNVRPYMILAGVGLHLSIIGTMGLFTFGLAMMVAYIVFLDDTSLRTVQILTHRYFSKAIVFIFGQRAVKTAGSLLLSRVRAKLFLTLAVTISVLVFLMSKTSQASLADPLSRFSEAICERDMGKAKEYVSNSLRSSLQGQIDQILKEIEKNPKWGSGFCQRIVRAGSKKFYLVYANTIREMVLTTAYDGKVTSVYFGRMTMRNAGTNQIARLLDELDGKLSLLIINEDGLETVTINPDLKLAVASSAKLFILDALRQKINAGEAKWDDLIRLDNKKMSLKSGILQDWPEGSPLTVFSLAQIMFAQSDNTAADHLIAFIGRDKIQKLNHLDELFLTTREIFQISSLSSQARNSLITLPNEKKAAAIASLANIPIDAAMKRPPKKEAVWAHSTRNLCTAMFRLKHMNMIKTNGTGLAGDLRWNEVAHKNGIAEGVIQSTYLLQKAKNDKHVCLSLTWNSIGEQDTDARKFVEALRTVIQSYDVSLDPDLSLPQPSQQKLAEPGAPPKAFVSVLE